MRLVCTSCGHMGETAAIPDEKLARAKCAHVPVGALRVCGGSYKHVPKHGPRNRAQESPSAFGSTLSAVAATMDEIVEATRRNGVIAGMLCSELYGSMAARFTMSQEQVDEALTTLHRDGEVKLSGVRVIATKKSLTR